MSSRPPAGLCCAGPLCRMSKLVNKMIDGFMFLRTIPFRWQRQVNGRREKQADERRLTIDARPSVAKNSLVISGGVKLVELYVQVRIFNIEPSSIAKEVQRPAEAIGWLECLEESGCLAGWFCVGPVNFEEIWNMPRHAAVDNWTLSLQITPLENFREGWLWDTHKTRLLWILDASLISIIETKDRPAH